MLIFHHGHSEFLIELADGFRILTDPFDAHVGYSMKKVRCNAVTVSHAHSDHNEVSKAEGYTVLADHAGKIVLEPGVIATGIESWHDDQQGTLRGSNRIFIIEAEGLRIAHLGDLGAWDESLAARLTDLDILLIPVGGHYTIDAQSAAALCRRLQPRVVIPMHYRTNANADWPIAPVEDFLSAMNAANAPRMPLLRVTDRDLSEQPRIAVLTEA